LDNNIISTDYLRVLLPVISLMINAISQVLSYRYIIKDSSLMKSVFIGFIFGLLIMLILDIYIGITYLIINRDFWFILLLNSIIYTCLSFCFFQIIGLGVSLRIRMLDYLEKKSEGATYDELNNNFDANSLFEVRLKRLTQSGQIIKKRDRYYSINSMFLLTARLNAAFKKFMIGKESEFD